MADRLEPIFNPRSIAVIGASRHRGKVGYAIMRNLIMNEYQGKLFPVNPKADSVWGIKAYPSVLDIPDSVDLAIIMIPADLVEGVVEEGGKEGVRGLVVITAGFREIGPVGGGRGEKAKDRARKDGV